MARSRWMQFCALIVAACALSVNAQTQSTPRVPRNQPPPHSQTPPGESSSRDTQTVDISPPPNDYEHAGDTTGVSEFQHWNPMRAMKDVEVGDFYYKKKNYRAAESRYAGALTWKPNDAIATFRLAQAEEKLGKKPEALKYYQQYLKILPDGDYAGDCKKAIARLQK